MKKLLSILVVLSCVMTLLGAAAPETSYAKVHSSVHSQTALKGKVSLNCTSIELTVGSSIGLSLKGVDAAKAKWSSSKKKVASVAANGWVTAKKKGSAVITAKYKGKSYTCVVKVVKKVPAVKKESAKNTDTSEGWQSMLTYKAKDKNSLYTALYDGFERRADTIRVEVPDGTAEMYCAHYTAGVRDDYFEILLKKDRVLQGYANDFNMTYGSDYVDFKPVYKTSWNAVTALRYDNYEPDKITEKTISAVKEITDMAEALYTDDADKLDYCYQKIGEMSVYRYSNTPGTRNYSEYDATSILFDGSGVCEGYASALQIVCELFGFKNIMVGGHAFGDNHAWNKIQVNGNWYNFDLTFDDGEGDTVGREYFMCCDSDYPLISDHTWNSEWYPATP